MIPSRSTSRRFLDGTRRGMRFDGLLITGLVGVGARAMAASGSHFVGERSNLSKRGRPLSRLDMVVVRRLCSCPGAFTCRCSRGGGVEGAGGCPCVASQVVRGGAESTAAFCGGGLAVVASSRASFYELARVGAALWPALVGSVLMAFSFCN